MEPIKVIQLLRAPPKLFRRCYMHIAGEAYRTAKTPHTREFAAWTDPPGNGQAPVATFQVEVLDDKTVSGAKSRLSKLLCCWTKNWEYVKVTKLDGAAKDDPAG